MINTSEKKDIIKGALDKVKLVDAGIKNKYGNEITSAPVDPKSRIYYPSLYLSAKEAPMLTGSEVGDEVTLLIKACVVSHSLSEGQNSDKKESFSLDIKKIGVVSTTPAEDEDDKE